MLGISLTLYFFGAGWLVILFASGSIFLERRAIQVNKTSKFRRWQLFGFIVVAITLLLPTALEHAINNLGAPESFRIMEFLYSSANSISSDPDSISLPLFLTLCALYGFSLHKQSRGNKRTEPTDAESLKGDANSVNDSLAGESVKHGIVPRTRSRLWRKILFRLLLMNGFYLVASVATAFFRWFTVGEPFGLVSLLLYGWFPWSVLFSGLFGYLFGILFAVGSVIVENRISNDKKPMIWRLGQLMGFAAVLIAIVLELVISDERPHPGYQPGIVPIIVCALYGYSLFAQRRDARHRVSLES